MALPTAKCKGGQMTDFGTMTFPSRKPDLFAGMIQINWKASDRDESATTTTTSSKTLATASNSDSTSGSASASRSNPDLVTIMRTPAMSKGAVAGTVVGVMVFVLFFPIGWLFRRNQRKKATAAASPESGNDSDSAADPTRSLVGTAASRPPGSSAAGTAQPVYADYPTEEVPGDYKPYAAAVYSVSQLDDTKVTPELPIHHEIHEVHAPGPNTIPELPGHSEVHEVHVAGAHTTPKLPTEPPAGTNNPPPSESTSTIVLTSPTGRFVDMRIFKEDPSSPNHSSIFGPQPQSQSSSEAEETKRRTLPLSRLDWAIAGTSTHTPTRPTIGYYGQKLILPDGRTVNGTVADLKQGRHPYVRGRWTHWVDSRVSYPTGEEAAMAKGVRTWSDEAAADEGDMYRIPEDERLTLEKGRMVNPATGKEEEYEEVWGPDDGEKEEGLNVKCVVWELDDEAGCKKGRVVRVGRWTQGILRSGNELLCERWKWVGAGGEDKAMRWRLEARVSGLVGGEEGRKLDEKDEALAFPEALVGDMISGGESGKNREVGGTVKGNNGDVWTLVELGP
ncbi:hypothetical protein QBC32DRAFT_366757 [Pseudoneurospora amorphoporcata]|uniref:Protein HRI1 n=1 Tax=Pseudoneurospora amorphoporcata TaxID=241081 RepID=A0AAN6P4H8_9PEZI|nr:hypothetical protein QBC32DRAFT_366757 [Pseudoneurospora amorphoporcata]